MKQSEKVYHTCSKIPEIEEREWGINNNSRHKNFQN